jgi:hypothetical protein
MTRISKLLIAAAASTVLGGTAFADDPPADGTEGGAGGDGTGGAPATGDGTAAAVEAPAGIWSMSIIDRPLNLLKGMIRVDGDLGIARLSITIPAIPPAPATTASATSVALRAGVGYGVSDKLEVGGSYAIQLKDFEAKGPLSAYGLFQLKNEKKLRISAGASATLDLAADNAFGIEAGLALQYHLNDKLFLFMPPSHVTLGLNPDTALAVNFPVGVGFQANPNIFASLQTNLADLGISPSGSAFIFADRTPITLAAFYSPSNKMDLGVSLVTPDVAHIGDIFAVLLSARLYFGKVPASGGAAMSTMTPPPAPAM